MVGIADRSRRAAYAHGNRPMKRDRAEEDDASDKGAYAIEQVEVISA
jgi:hypothetical protein